MIRAVAVRQRSQAPAELFARGARIALSSPRPSQHHPGIAHRSALSLVLALPPG